jgi:dihydrodipicolinate synthase/N-acetylneuraminate lyase
MSKQLPEWVLSNLQQGTVIPAHPLALDEQGRFDVAHQRALSRYYAAAGAGGLAVGVHTTQFAIRDPAINLYKPVLETAAQVMDKLEKAGKPLIRVAGICGPTKQAVREAMTASDLGYHLGLLSLAAMKEADDAELLRHCEAVGEKIPLVGFYLQPAVGGRRLSFDFWRRFAEIPSVLAIKMAPFNRYQTLDVVRGVAMSSRAGQIALYTGNDDNIIPDLLTRYELAGAGGNRLLRIVGGLLGHWAVWTRRAVEIFQQVRQVAVFGPAIPPELLSLSVQVTDSNAALFDATNNFAGCIAGIQYVLWRQGLLASTRCLDANERLSPGQQEEIERVRTQYPHLIDDDFVRANLSSWLG